MESALYKTAPADLFVIETLGFEPARGFTRLALHMDRAEATCGLLGITFERGLALQILGDAVEGFSDKAGLRCRLTVDRQGVIDVSTRTLEPGLVPWRVMLSDQRLEASDPWLRVKTSQRALYDRARQTLTGGVDEVIFLNGRGEVCEGTITNVFVQAGENLLTPPLGCGLLPGVLRAELLQQGRAVEQVLSVDDLLQAEALFVGNSLRGLIPARLL